MSHNQDFLDSMINNIAQCLPSHWLKIYQAAFEKKLDAIKNTCLSLMKECEFAEIFEPSEVKLFSIEQFRGIRDAL